MADRFRRIFGCWCLDLLWSLDVGAWILVSGAVTNKPLPTARATSVTRVSGGMVAAMPWRTWLSGVSGTPGRIKSFVFMRWLTHQDLPEPSTAYHGLPYGYRAASGGKT